MNVSERVVWVGRFKVTFRFPRLEYLAFANFPFVLDFIGFPLPLEEIR